MVYGSALKWQGMLGKCQNKLNFIGIIVLLHVLFAQPIHAADLKKYLPIGKTDVNNCGTWGTSFDADGRASAAGSIGDSPGFWMGGTTKSPTMSTRLTTTSMSGCLPEAVPFVMNFEFNQISGIEYSLKSPSYLFFHEQVKTPNGEIGRFVDVPAVSMYRYVPYTSGGVV
jgi:hypothetical protein